MNEKVVDKSILEEKVLNMWQNVMKVWADGEANSLDTKKILTEVEQSKAITDVKEGIVDCFS